MKRLSVSLLIVALMAGCTGMSDTQQRTLSGAAIGTAGGAAIGAIAGNAGLGAAIGAGAGIIGGLVVDKIEKDKEAAYSSGYNDGKATTN